MLSRVPILIINRDPAFAEDPENTVERRGTALYEAQSVEEVARLLKEQRFPLSVVNACSAHFPPESIRSLHTGLRRRAPRAALVVLSPRDEVAGFQALDLPDLHILIPPLKHRFLLEITGRIVRLGSRRAAHTVAQVFPPTGGMLMGFVVEVSRFGLLMKLDQGPDAGDPSVALRFVLAGTKGQNEVRARLVRSEGFGTDRRYAFEFTDVDEESQVRLDHFVSRA